VCDAPLDLVDGCFTPHGKTEKLLFEVGMALDAVVSAVFNEGFEGRSEGRHRGSEGWRVGRWEG
jgi:hypothetical protein